MGFDKTKQCEYCGREKEFNPGDYYHEMSCWRSDVLRRMEAEGETPALKRELWRASYTGD